MSFFFESGAETNWRTCSGWRKTVHSCVGSEMIACNLQLDLARDWFFQPHSGQRSTHFVLLPAPRVSWYHQVRVLQFHLVSVHQVRHGTFHCMAPPSTSASQIHAFDLSASFWPLSSLARSVNSIYTIRIEDSSHLGISVSHLYIAASHTRPCICILKDVSLDWWQLQLVDAF